MLVASPPIVKVMIWCQVLPAAALATRRDQTVPAKLVAGAYMWSLVTDLVGRYVGRTYGNNHWVSLISVAGFTCLLLWACGEWQVTPVERLAFRIAIALFLLVFAVLVFAVDGWITFPRFAYPFSTVVTLGGALWTLLRRSARAPDVPVLRTDWFLILLGVAFHAAVTSVTSPMGAVLMRYQRIDVLTQVWQLRAALVIVALVVISFGMRRAAPGPAA